MCGLECRRHHVAAFFHLLLGKLYDQNGILGHQTYEHHQADLKIDVVFQTANPDTQIGTDSGYGQRENDRDGHRPALVLRREEQEDEEEGQRQHVARLAADVLFLIGKSTPFKTYVVRQMIACYLFHDLHSLTGTVSVGRRTVHANGREHVETFDAAWSRRIGSRT